MSFNLPVVNGSQIEELLEEGIFRDGKFQPMKDAMGIAGGYPRWMLKTNISRIVNDEMKSLGSVLHVGDSQRENVLRVADGFPEDTLADDEIMIPEAFHHYLGFNEPPESAYERNETQKVDLNFDLSPFFEEDPNAELTRGEMLL